MVTVKGLYVLVLFVGIASSHSGIASPGDLDPSFYLGSRIKQGVNAISVLPDGKDIDQGHLQHRVRRDAGWPGSVERRRRHRSELYSRWLIGRAQGGVWETTSAAVDWHPHTDWFRCC